MRNFMWKWLKFLVIPSKEGVGGRRDIFLHAPVIAVRAKLSQESFFACKLSACPSLRFLFIAFSLNRESLCIFPPSSFSLSGLLQTGSKWSRSLCHWSSLVSQICPTSFSVSSIAQLLHLQQWVERLSSQDAFCLCQIQGGQSLGKLFLCSWHSWPRAETHLLMLIVSKKLKTFARAMQKTHLFSTAFLY